MASYQVLKVGTLLLALLFAFFVVGIGPASAQAPTIEHTPPANAHLGTAMNVQARVTDDGTVMSVDLYYRGVADADFRLTAMAPDTGGVYGPSDANLFVATIPAQQSLGQITYYISASDDQGNVARSPAAGEHSVPVSETAPPVTIDPLFLSYIAVPIVVAVGIVAYVLLRRRRAAEGEETTEE